jgi:hypothetical protein
MTRRDGVWCGHSIRRILAVRTLRYFIPAQTHASVDGLFTPAGHPALLEA